MRQFNKCHWAVALSLSAALLLSCKSSSGSGGFDILGPSDETAEAGKLILEANQDLTKIKVLYKENEGKRQELKNALETDNEVEVKKISDHVVSIINEGTAFGMSAIDKIKQAQSMEINSDFRDYLQLKEEALTSQMEAFENYRKAALSLRDNYDPKNAQLREKVKVEFTERSENYQKIMEKARDFSNQANELYKETLKKQRS
ncbi:MAG: hypothetical protein ACT4O9_11445 [Blastocatellia bacterium]